MSEIIYHEHHCHSHYSLRDCVSKIPEIVEKSVKLGRTSVTLTDHGTLAGTYDLVDECKKHKVKPILGVEGYYVDDYEDEASTIPYNYAHIILLAKNAEGWQNLKDLQSIAWEKGYLKKPRICLSDLKNKGKGIICTTSCIRGLVGWNLLKETDKYNSDESLKYRKSIIKKRLQQFMDIFGKDLYLEMQFNDIDVQRTINAYALSLHHKYGISLTAAGDCHYVRKKDYKIHDIMICHSRKKLLSDTDNGTYGTHQLFIKNTKQIKNAWETWHKDYISEESFNNAIKSTLEIRDKVETFDLKPKRVCFPDWKDPIKDFKAWIDRGWNTRLTNEQQESKKYLSRLKYELEVYEKLKMEPYMLVCADIIQRAKKANIPCGPGRGSVCGSLVAFLMEISEIDPIRFNTSFDRFLTADRQSLPDIDMDFGQRKRDKIKKIVADVYGEKNFAAIATYGDWKPRGLIKDIGRVLGMQFQDLNNITKLIHDKTKKFQDEEYPMSQEAIDWLNQHKDVYKPAKRLEGIYRVRGAHASGMILTPTRLEDWAPTAYSVESSSEDKKPIKVSEWDMYALEDLQILKMDFLGLKTLDVIQMCVQLINKKTSKYGIQEIQDIWAKCLNDLENKKIYEELSQGHIVGMFQLETSDGMLELCKNMKPKCFHDIVLLISLYRTAIIQAGMLDEYVARRNGEDFDYIHPKVKPVLESTLGILVFQEQLMEIGVVVGGLSRYESDSFRKATKLKDLEKFNAWKERMIQGFKKNGLSISEGKTLWDWCVKFSGYGFNVSHAVGYGLITYVTAWLKVHYPEEYMCAVMSFNTDEDKMMDKYVAECNRLEIPIRKPDINKSASNFKLDYTDESKTKLIQPFSCIKNIGQKVLDNIRQVRKNGKIESFKDFFDKCDKRVCNVRVMTNLILSGAFNKLEEGIEDTFNQFIYLRDDKVYRQLYCKECQYRYPCSINKNNVGNATCPSCGSVEVIFGDKKCETKKFSKSFINSQIYGFSVGGNPLKKYVKQIVEMGAEPISILEDVEEGDLVCVKVFVKKIKKHIDKKGNEMAFIDLSDGETDSSLTIFSSNWASLKEHIVIGCSYIVKACKNRGTNLLFTSYRGSPKSEIFRLGM